MPICFDGSPLATGISIVQHLKGKLLLYTVVFGSKTFCFLASMDHLISVTSLQVETMARVARAMCLFVNWSVLSNDPPFQLVFQSFEVAVKGKEEGNHKCNETKEINVVQLIWSERKLSGRLPEIKHGFGGQIRSSWKQIKWNNLKAELNSTRWWDALVVPFYVTFSCSVVIIFFYREPTLVGLRFIGQVEKYMLAWVFWRCCQPRIRIENCLILDAFCFVDKSR